MLHLNATQTLHGLKMMIIATTIQHSTSKPTAQPVQMTLTSTASPTKQIL